MIKNSGEIINRLLKEGWVLVRTRGDHHIFKQEKFSDLISVSHPNKDLPTGTVHTIYKVAGWKKTPERGKQR
jgi:predicted RNA binding protein YcfA (HicA-like mRNA interferase family)